MEQRKPAELTDDDLERVQGGFIKIEGIDRKVEKTTKLSEDGKRGEKSIMASSGTGSI